MRRHRHNLARLLPALLVLAMADVRSADDRYAVNYSIEPDPFRETAAVEMRLKQSSALLREVRMRMPAGTFEVTGGDGHVVHDQGRLTWLPPPNGGTLRWRARIANRRSGDGYDAFMNADWAMFRASDIIPPAATRTRVGAHSTTTMAFKLPSGWSVVTEYARSNGKFVIRNPDRRYDRPTGWILMGEIGTRTDLVDGIRVTVAAPQGQDVRRMDMLALLRWTMPEVLRVFPDFPQRFTVVSARDPMWRGGLSAPASVFIHADRPLISENGTSTLLHEAAHVGLGLAAEPGYDWIVEGMAEYYSAQFLRRSGTISEARYKRTLTTLEGWGNEQDSLCGESSSGALTARAAVLFARLDDEIRAASDGAASLDDVTRALALGDKKINLQDLRALSRKLTGKDSNVLRQTLVSDCPD